VIVEITQVERDQTVALATELPAGRAFRRIDWRRAGLAFATTGALLLLILGAFAIGYDGIHSGKILPGVRVAGVQVGGLAPTHAEAAVRAGLPNPRAGQLTVLLGDATATIPYSAIGRDYDMASMLGQALSIGRGGFIVEELRTLAHGAGVQPSVTWNDAALVTQLDAIYARAEAVPVDATIVREGARYVVVPAVDGRAFDREAAYLAAVAALSDPALPTATISSDVRLMPAAVSSVAAQTLVDRVESASGNSLTVNADGQSMVIPTDVLRGWIRLTAAAPGEWNVAIAADPIAQYLAEFKLDVDVPAVNATYTFQARQATVVADVNGLEIETEPAVAAVVGELEARATGAAPKAVNLAVSTVLPDFTAAEAQALVSRVERLGRWTTRFVPGPLNANGVNIQVPTKLINGTVVEPGETFDFIDAAGPFTKRNGYDDGAAIRNGRTVFEGVLGGGLCSASTTLFNAVARAGFQVDARHNHGYYIGRYPVGLDATIWEYGGTRKTMAFTNDSDYPLLIRGMYSHGRVTFEVWGVSDGRTVDYSKPRIEREREATTYVEYSSDLPPGEYERAEFEVDGFDSWVTRTVRNASGAIIHENTWFSDYRKVDGLYKFGRSPGDPKDGTKVLAEDFVPPEG